MYINKKWIILIIGILLILIGGIYVYKNTYFGPIENRSILKYFNSDNIIKENGEDVTLKNPIPNSYNIPSREYSGLNKNKIYNNLIEYNNTTNKFINNVINEVNNSKNSEDINQIHGNIINFIMKKYYVYSMNPISENQKESITYINEIAKLLYYMNNNNTPPFILGIPQNIIDNINQESKTSNKKDSIKKEIIILANKVKSLTSYHS